MVGLSLHVEGQPDLEGRNRVTGGCEVEVTACCDLLNVLFQLLLHEGTVALETTKIQINDLTLLLLTIRICLFSFIGQFC